MCARHLRGPSVVQGLSGEMAAPIHSFSISHTPAAMSFNYSLESIGSLKFIIHSHHIRTSQTPVLPVQL